MNVLQAAQRRIRFIFDEFERVVVSVSGGKDSTCLYFLVLDEARRRGRRFGVFFLDQEAEYQSTIDMIELMMRHELVEPYWFQVPIRMTNATSHRQLFLHAWADGEEWIRPKSDIAIHRIYDEYPDRFYPFFNWFERQDPVPTAHLVGLRIFESMNRQRTMLRKDNGYQQRYGWSTVCGNGKSYRFYPIFDWHARDVWKYIADNGLPYNKVYDRMYAAFGADARKMRVSNLIHEQAFRSLAQLQEFEPDTYDRLLKRLAGVHCAAQYANEPYVFRADRLPPFFPSWRAYRDYLLETTPTEARERYIARFSKQPDDEAVHQHQVKQLLLNDWEGRLPRTRSTSTELRKLWWDKL